MAVDLLKRLKALGTHLCIDDFGTGYSSLSYLRRFPVDVLKVDRGFVSGVDGGAGDAAIVGAVIRLADDLGLVVIAEGVETAEQVKMLRALGCRQAQGFHFSRPQPADELGALLGL